MSETRRRGRWAYGNHEGLNPGWRLDGTNLVLDYDPRDGSGSVIGCYIIWTDGRPGDPIDHYLDNAMAYVETHIAAPFSQRAPMNADTGGGLTEATFAALRAKVSHVEAERDDALRQLSRTLVKQRMSLSDPPEVDWWWTPLGREAHDSALMADRDAALARVEAMFAPGGDFEPCGPGCVHAECEVANAVLAALHPAPSEAP